MSFSGSYTAAALYSELSTDPKSLGYSTYIAVPCVGSETAICNLINGLIGPFPLTQATFSSGSVTYAGTISEPSNNYFAGYKVNILGFQNSGNNGTFTISSSTSTTLVCTNASGVNETHSALAAIGSGVGIIQLVTMTSDQIAAILLPLLSAATSLTALRYSYYQLIFNMIMAQQGSIVLSGLATLSTQMISDGIMTSNQAVALGQRSGTRAEAIWGQGTIVSSQDVYQALGWTF